MTDTTREALISRVRRQHESGHCGESTPDCIARQRHNDEWQEIEDCLNRLSEMEEALEPFADIARLLEGLSEPDSINLFVRKGSGEMGARIRTVALADFRRARQALSSPDKGVSE